MLTLRFTLQLYSIRCHLVGHLVGVICEVFSKMCIGLHKLSFLGHTMAKQNGIVFLEELTCPVVP